MKKRYDTTNYVPAYPPRLTRPQPVHPQQGASVFVAIAVVTLVILALLAVGVVGIVGRWQHWPAQMTALACLATWGGAALLSLPWLVGRVYPEVQDFFDDLDESGGGGN